MTGSVEQRIHPPTSRTWIGLAVVLLAVLMGQIDMFAVTVAAPAIQADLGASFGQLQLIISGYVIAYAAGMVTGGRLGDRLGRRRVFWSGAAGFTLASLLCGLAPTAGLLIAARVLQGAAASVMMPQVLAMIRVSFADGSPRSRAVGAYGAVIGLGVIAGLIGGGVLLSIDLAGLGWRTIFFINVPIGLAVTLATPATVEESRTSNPPRLDAVGALLAGLTLAAVLIPLSLGTGAGWPPWSWASLSAGMVLLAGFLTYQRTVARRGGEPIVPPRLFTSRGFALSMLTVAVFYAGNAGLFLVLTYHLQAGLRLGPLATGLAFTPLGAGFAVASAAGKRLASRFGARVATAGAVLMAISLLLVPAVTGTNNVTQAWALAGVLGLSGLGQGLVVALLLSTVLSLISTDDAGAGAGVLNTVTQASMATGVATIGALYQAVLGTNPDKPTIPLDTSQFTTTFNIVALALAALAVATAILLERLRSTGQRNPSDVRR